MMPLVAGSSFGVFHHHVGRGLVSIVLLSLASAASYGMAAVLQHQAAIREPPELSLRAGLLVSLAHRPLWLVGNALDGVGYLFQFLALRQRIAGPGRAAPRPEPGVRPPGGGLARAPPSLGGRRLVDRRHRRRAGAVPRRGATRASAIPTRRTRRGRS